MRRIALGQTAYLRSALPVAMALAMIVAACGRSGSDMTDGPNPFAAPTPFEVTDTVIATPSPEEILFAPVVSELGYALVPR